MTDREDGSRASLHARAELETVRLFLAHSRGSLVAVTLMSIGVALAWHDEAPPRVRLAWCLGACANYLAQGVLCTRLAHALAGGRPVRRLLHALTTSVGVACTIWGLVPWLLAGASGPAVSVASAFNVMILFAASHAPATRAMLATAATTMSLPTMGAILHADGLGVGALVAALFFATIIVNGLRLQDASRAATIQRLSAEDLALELSHQQQRLIEVEHERTLLLERERLMRDIHDGLGATLTSSLAAVEHGRAGAAEVAGMLRDSLDDLRLVIDSLEPGGHDVVALLADLRHRIERRLALAGIALHWRMDDLPPLEWLGPSEALQLMRAIQEMFTNVIKHAAARQVRVSAEADAEGIEVAIVDDGVGFDAEAQARGRGLPQVRRRLAGLGGGLSIDSSRGRGTVVRIRLPLARG